MRTTLLTCLSMLFSAILFAQVCPTGTNTNKALLAGDSWAQYMWDDGTYNIIFDKFGIGDKLMLSQSLGSRPDPSPPYTGPEYAVSGSLASDWANKVSYPWIANIITELNANPDVETLVLSIGGNDILAGRSLGGWYQNMDDDVAGSEAALFNTIKNNTFTIINDVLAVRPDLKILISSYDYPNFDVGLLWCAFYACPKRRDLSYSDTSPLITDAELNQMMITIETERLTWLDEEPQLFYDNSIGLSHYYYGDGSNAPGTLPFPDPDEPFSATFYGGNPNVPTLRSNFRTAPDPIHLDAEAYEYKIINQTKNYFLPLYRNGINATYFSNGGAEDGWTTGNMMGTDAVRVGDRQVNQNYYGILSFDTSNLPDDATITSTSLYLLRNAISNVNPFTSGTIGAPMVDVKSGTFGLVAVENSDATASADAIDAGCFHGTVSADGYALRIDLNAAGMAAVNKTGTTQFRIYFPNNDAGADYIDFNDGDAIMDTDVTTESLAEYMGDARPFLDISYTVPVPVELISFDVRVRDHDAFLYWSSAIEDNFLGYEIEYSKNALQWRALDFMEGTGSGSYEFIHKNLKQGTHYYRLKMIDLDGSYEYSDMKSVRIQTSKPIVSIFPNPFNEQIKIITNSNQKLEINIFDVLGKTIYSNILETNNSQQEFTIQMDKNLPSGIYYLQLKNEEEFQVVKLSKK